jgi:hypothetical protein
MFPGWLLIRPPRPERTSFSLSSEMRPPSPGLTNTWGGGMEPPFALGIFDYFIFLRMCCVAICICESNARNSSLPTGAPPAAVAVLTTMILLANCNAPIPTNAGLVHGQGPRTTAVFRIWDLESGSIFDLFTHDTRGHDMTWRSLVSTKNIRGKLCYLEVSSSRYIFANIGNFLCRTDRRPSAESAVQRSFAQINFNSVRFYLKPQTTTKPVLREPPATSEGI